VIVKNESKLPLIKNKSFFLFTLILFNPKAYIIDSHLDHAKYNLKVSYIIYFIAY